MTRIIAAACAAALAFTLAAPALAGKVAAREATRPAPQRFSVEVIGTGPDVILIPGLISPRAVWRPEAAQLKARFRVHLVQIRGFGDDPGLNAEGPVLAPFVAELARYIAGQRLNHPAVIGHSMGGLAAMMLAADYPDLPGRILVVDAVPFLPALFDPAATVASSQPQAEQMKMAMLASARHPAPITGTGDCAGLTGDAPLMRGTMARTNAAQCTVRQWGAASDPRVGAQAMVDAMTTDLRERIARITAPLTVVYAADSRLMPPEDFAALYRSNYARAPAARLVAVKDSLHFIMLDQPEALDRAIRIFLEDSK